MLFPELKKLLENTAEHNRNIFPDITLRFSEKPYDSAATHAAERLEFSDKKGLLVFTLPDDQIILIDKSETVIGEDLKRHEVRVRIEAMRHNRDDAYASWDRFLMYPIRVKPAVYSPLLVVFSLTYIFTKEGMLPLLNDSIC
jgi:hypothetical protein